MPAPSTPEPPIQRALVVGGGIAGLATAAGLHRAGIACEIVERNERWEPLGAGIVLSVNAMAVVRDLGLEDTVREAGCVLGAGAITDEQGRILSAGDFGSLEAEFGPTVALHRADLHEALLSAADVLIALGTTIDRIDSNSEGCAVRLSDGREAHFDLVVGADGIRSRVRQLVFGNIATRYAGYTCWRMVVDFPTTDVAQHVMWGPALRFGIVPIGRDRLYCFAVANAPQGQPDPPEGRLERFRERFAVFGGPVPKILAALREAQQLIPGDLEELERCPWSRGHCVLVGDAAHAMTPNMGQGAAMALEDAAVLVEELTRTKPAPVEDRLANFAARREPRVRWVQAQSRRIGRAAQIESRWLQGLRNALVRRMPTNPMERALRRLASQAL